MNSGTNNSSGFYELTHTADRALYVWAPDYQNLLIAAAKGLYFLMDIKLLKEKQVSRNIILEADDAESMLVTFLSEILYIADEENLGFDVFILKIQEKKLSALADGYRIAPVYNEIKAVTYHDLKINQTETGFDVSIVFDV